MSEIRHHGYPCPMSDDEMEDALWKLGGYSPESVAVQETIAHLRAENERLREMIEIEREGQRSMARALSEINRLSRLDVAIALAAPQEEGK